MSEFETDNQSIDDSNSSHGRKLSHESSVVLTNELQEAFRDEGNGRWTSNSLAEASGHCTTMRRPRAPMALQKAATACRCSYAMEGKLMQSLKSF